MTGHITDFAAASALTGSEPLELSQLSPTVRITGTTLSAQASDNSFNDSGSGFVTAGFAAGDRVNVSGFTGNVANNLYVGIVTTLAAGKLTIGGTDGDVIVDDTAGESVTIAKWVTRRVTAQEIADLAGGAIVVPTTQSGTAYTAALTDAPAGQNYQGYIRFTNAGAITFTIPPNATDAFEIGTVISFEQSGAGVVTLTPGSGVTINSRGGVLATAGQYAVAQVKKVATDTWTAIGDLA